METVRGDHPLLFGIHQAEVRRGSGSDKGSKLSGAAKDSSWTRGEQLDGTNVRDDVIVHEPQDRSQSGRETDHAKGRIDKAALLLIRGMRCVIRCDRIDGPIGNGIDQGLAVVFASKGRVHLEGGVSGPTGLVGEKQVLRL